MLTWKIESGFWTAYGEDGTERIASSPIGILVVDGVAYAPIGSHPEGDTLILSFPAPCGDCRLTVEEKKGYTKLTLCTAPEDADGFVFGPYRTHAQEFGEMLGAAWEANGGAVCIQSLMPKVVEGFAVPVRENRTGLAIEAHPCAAMPCGESVSLQCSAVDMSHEHRREDGFLIKPVQGADGKIKGAAIALIGAASAQELLSVIGEMEVAEGLPHPTYLGSYAKTDKRVSSYYLIFNGKGCTNEELVQTAINAGVSCFYFSDVFDRWGHFRVNPKTFPGGIAEVAANSAVAYQHGVLVGAHSLSNFIHTHDPYVTPVPHEHLLVRDYTSLVGSIDAEACELTLAAPCNYDKPSRLNLLRIESELITFEAFDPATCRLSGLTRGAYGTSASAHADGEAVMRLCDHEYGTVFPDIDLQDEVADALGAILRDCGIRKFSFDGLEGCGETGYYNYARASFVKRVFDIVGNELLCDGSNTSHYLWHAFSYCNWGEPWYDDARRGSQYVLRMRHQPFFERNLIPRMFGWFLIATNRGRYEATTPENMEFMLSRSVAFDAGLALSVNMSVVKKHGLFDEYMRLTKLWGRLREEGEIPPALREKMQEETANWHLTETEDGWELTELALRVRDLDYCDRVVQTEAGEVGMERHALAETGRIEHHSRLVLDAPYPCGTDYEPLRFRLRVGEPGHGRLWSLHLYGKLFFDMEANGGDYLVYEGGTELKHYDCNFNLLATIRGEGEPILLPDAAYSLFGSIDYVTDDDPHARYLLTEIRRKHIDTLKRRRT